MTFDISGEPTGVVRPYNQFLRYYVDSKIFFYKRNFIISIRNLSSHKVFDNFETTQKAII